MKITLYVLIAIAWLVINIVKAVRKANQEQQKKKAPHSPSIPTSPKPAQTAKRSLEEVIRTTNKKTTRAAEQQPVTRPAYTSQEVIIDEASYDTELQYSSGASLYKSQESLTGDNADDIHQHTEIARSQIGSDTGESEGSEIDFDIRKAVIYSEILKRPYV